MDNRAKACLAIIMALRANRHQGNRNRCMKEWLKKREQYFHLVLLKKICLNNVEDFKNYFRMESTYKNFWVWLNRF